MVQPERALTRYDPAIWDQRYFREFLMVPQGSMFLRVAYVTDSDDTYWRTLWARWTSLEYWTHPSEYRPELKGSIGEGPNHSNHSNSFKIGIFRNFSLENSKISENFNIL